MWRRSSRKPSRETNRWELAHHPADDGPPGDRSDALRVVLATPIGVPGMRMHPAIGPLPAERPRSLPRRFSAAQGLTAGELASAGWAVSTDSTMGRDCSAAPGGVSLWDRDGRGPVALSSVPDVG